MALRTGSPDRFSVERVRAVLGTKYLGQNLHYLPETSSTNLDARELAEAGAPEGTLVITDYQSQGRGRLQRRWSAPPGSSLLMSLLFRPTLSPSQAHQLTMVCGLAVADAIESEIGLAAGLKWPNDILIDGAKTGGILTETGVLGLDLEYVIVGIGLNVNLDPRDLPDDLVMPASSLSQALGRPVERESLLLSFLEAAETRYEQLKLGESVVQAWASRLVTLGKPVTVSSSGQSVNGVAEKVGEDGALWVRLDNGQLQRIVVGDVSLRV